MLVTLNGKMKNGAPETKVDVNFQLLQHDQENQVTSLVVILSFMIVFDKFVISGTISQVNHVEGRIVNEPSELTKKKSKPWHVHVWTCSIVWRMK